MMCNLLWPAVATKLLVYKMSYIKDISEHDLMFPYMHDQTVNILCEVK